ncbi:unnamed protein product [Protopolystoma xenopodis]|uniref:FAD/NAD(P)-binding domain-containing protein n=1 Tax=Protopolystoma xenopodis TaxID=117903 RepID=A0A448WCT4_9PLAT|nr:unnamed protein product [Protopolystoma xenopodis]
MHSLPSFRQGLRCYVTTDNVRKHYKLVIVGGGAGGCSVSAKMSGFISKDELLVIEPSDTHYYQPLWTLVGAGINSLKDSMRPTHETLSPGVKWLKSALAKLIPEENRILTTTGDEITYDYLILSLGLDIRFDMIKGAPEALLKDPRVCSNYSKDYVEKTASAIKAFQSGHALFTFPSGPIKCAGAPQKIMYLFEDKLSRIIKNFWPVGVLWFVCMILSNG